MIEHAEIDDRLADSISADEIQTCKPAVELYQHAATRTGASIEETTHVTAGWVNLMGAHHVGMQTAWVDRESTPREPLGPPPDLTVDTFYYWLISSESEWATPTLVTLT